MGMRLLASLGIERAQPQVAVGLERTHVEFLGQGGGSGAPVVVEVPAIEAPRPSASFAFAESEPKLMPAMVIGICRVIGFLAKRPPSVTSVPQRSR